MRRLPLLGSLVLLLPAVASAYEGYGYATTGGTGGTVCNVTTTAASGAGSLLNCISTRPANQHTIINFTVSGTIVAGDDLSITQPYLTIDGYTAPSPGITVRPSNSGGGNAFVIDNTHDVIIRGLHLQGYETGGDADLIALDGTDGSEVYNVVIDHNSLTDADDGAIDTTGNVHDVTISWNLVWSNELASLNKYDSRTRISYHHNIYANNTERNPQIKGDASQIDFRNNIIYDWGDYGLRLWAGDNTDSAGTPYINIVGNAFVSKAGSGDCGIEVMTDSGVTAAQRYVSDNISLPDALCVSSNISELTIPSAAQVTTLPSGLLHTVVFQAGAMPRTTAEQALITELGGYVKYNIPWGNMPFATPTQEAIWAHMRQDYDADPDCPQNNTVYDDSNFPGSCQPATEGGQLYKLVRIGNSNADSGTFDGFMYHMTGDAAWAARGWAKLNALMHLPDATSWTKADYVRPGGFRYLTTFAWVYPSMLQADIDYATTRFNAISQRIITTYPFSTPGGCSDTDQISGEYLFTAYWHAISESWNTAGNTIWAHAGLGGYDASVGAETTYPVTTMRNCVAWYEQFVEGGFWLEPPQYNLTTPTNELMAEKAITDITGVAHYQSAFDLMEEFGLNLIHQVTSDSRRAIQFCDEQHPNSALWYYRYAQMLIVHSVIKNTNAGKYLRSRMNALWAQYGTSLLTGYPNVGMYVMVDPYTTAGGLDYHNLPLSYWNPGVQVYHSRTSWDANPANSTMMTVHNTRLIGNPIGYVGNMSTTFFDHGSQYNMRIFFYKNGEDLHPQKNTYGGIGTDERGGDGVTLRALPMYLHRFKEGDKIRGPVHDETNGFDYISHVTGGAFVKSTPAYSPPTIPQIAHELSKSVVWLRNLDAYITHDRTNGDDLGTNASAYTGGFWAYTSANNMGKFMRTRPHFKEYYTQMMVQPTVANQEITWPTVSNGNNKVKVLLPVSPVMTIEDDRVAWRSCTQFEPNIPDPCVYNPGQISDSQYGWHVITSPPADQKWDTFLFVYSLSTNPVTPTLVQDVANHVDATLVSYTGGHYLVAFNAIQGPNLYPFIVGYDQRNQTILDNVRLRNVGFTLAFNTTAATKAILTDLDPSIVWTYKVNGGTETSLTVDTEGVGVISIATTGALTLNVLAGGAVPVPPVSIQTASLPDGRIGSAYSQTLTAVGGNNGPYTWTKTVGSFPGGLTMSGGGVISGTPTTFEDQTFTVQACDSVPSCGTRQLAISISDNPIITSNLPGGKQNEAYDQQLASVGGTTPYAYTVTAGALCTGLSMNGTGHITGTPTVAETCDFTVTVTDADTITGTKAFTVTIEHELSGITVDFNPGSRSTTVNFGIAGLRRDETCTVSINDCYGLELGSVTSTSGLARRQAVFTGLVGDSGYCINVDCPTASTTQQATVVTQPFRNTTQTFNYQLHVPDRIYDRAVAIDADLSSLLVAFHLTVGDAEETTTTYSYATYCNATTHACTLPVTDLHSGETISFWYNWEDDEVDASKALGSTRRHRTYLAIP